MFLSYQKWEVLSPINGCVYSARPTEFRSTLLGFLGMFLVRNRAPANFFWPSPFIKLTQSQFFFKKWIQKLYKYLLKVLTCHSELHVEVILIQTHGALQDKTYYFFKMHIRRLREIQELTVCLTYGKQGSKKYTPKSNDFFFLFTGSPKSALDNIACDLSKKMSSKVQF